jgi:hypothetical protein
MINKDQEKDESLTIITEYYVLNPKFYNHGRTFSVCLVSNVYIC